MTDHTLARRIEQAFKQTTRSHFMPAAQQYWAGLDAPSPIGFGQTISQPTTVKNMLTWLAPQPGQKILDVGSGSGWSSALLSFLVGDQGEVFATERIPELKRFGEDNCQSFGCCNIRFFLTQDGLGLMEHGPFDGILVSAAAHEGIPQVLVDQLAPLGRLVVPVNNSIFELQKDAQGELDYCREHIGYVFVPLVFAEV